jgi:hypothetical protein
MATSKKPAQPDPQTDVDAAPAIPVFEEVDAPELVKPKYMVVGNTFIAQTEEGEIRVLLAWKTKVIRNTPLGLDLLGQLFYLIGEESETAKVLDELDIVDAREVADKLFQAFQEKQQARLGK